MEGGSSKPQSATETRATAPMSADNNESAPKTKEKVCVEWEVLQKFADDNTVGEIFKYFLLK